MHNGKYQCHMAASCTYHLPTIIIDRFYIALFSALEQTHCARMCFIARF